MLCMLHPGIASFLFIFFYLFVCLFVFLVTGSVSCCGKQTDPLYMYFYSMNAQVIISVFAQVNWSGLLLFCKLFSLQSSQGISYHVTL